MPRLSDSMEEGTIVRWLKQDGDRVVQGEPLAEVETDKATVTFDADADGTLRILVAEGETVALGAVIARIGEANALELAPATAGNGSQRVKASPLARRIARESGIDLSALSGSGPGGRIVKADLEGAASPRGAGTEVATGAGTGAGTGDDCCRARQQGRGDHTAAVPHPGADRPAHGRVAGDHPRLHARGGDRHAERGCAARRSCAWRARPRSSRPTTTWS